LVLLLLARQATQDEPRSDRIFSVKRLLMDGINPAQGSPPHEFAPVGVEWRFAIRATIFLIGYKLIAQKRIPPILVIWIGNGRGMRFVFDFAPRQA
jgi:hypothetical protein